MTELADLESLKRQVAQAAAAERRRAGRRMRAAQLALMLAFLGFWQALSGPVLDPFFVSSPARIVAALGRLYLEDELLRHAYLTTLEAVGGYVLGAAVAVLLAFAATSWGQLYKVLEPFILALNGIRQDINHEGIQRHVSLVGFGPQFFG